MKPQINERRFNNRLSSSIRALEPINAPSACWYENKINDELGQTHNELTLPEFVSVRKSLLFFSCSFINQRFIADFVVRLHIPQRVQKNANGGAINGCS